MQRDKGSVEIERVQLFPRRLGLLRVHPDYLLDVLRQTMPMGVRMSGIPADARLIDFFRDDTCFTLLLESYDFAMVEAGGAVPEITVVIAYWPLPVTQATPIPPQIQIGSRMDN